MNLLPTLLKWLFGGLGSMWVIGMRMSDPSEPLATEISEHGMLTINSSKQGSEQASERAREGIETAWKSVFHHPVLGKIMQLIF